MTAPGTRCFSATGSVTGQVWLSTPDFLLAGEVRSSTPLGFFGRLLVGLGGEAPFRLATVDGDGPVPDVSWVAARQNDDRVVVVVNHGGEPVETSDPVAWPMQGGPGREG